MVVLDDDRASAALGAMGASAGTGDGVSMAGWAPRAKGREDGGWDGMKEEG